MKTGYLVVVSILGATVAVGGHAQAACDARQEFCTYPTWAANAFSPQAQKPRFASGYPEAYLAPDMTDYGYGPVFAYAPTYGSAAAYSYGPAYGYAPTYRSAAAYGYNPAYGAVPTYRYVAADTYGPVYGFAPRNGSAVAYGYGPAYGYASTRRYAAANSSGRAYGYVARRTDARGRRDWRWPSPGWPIYRK
jgi:hypothetical protein